MSRFKAVALDMMGVVYLAGDDLRDLIIPFLKREGFSLGNQVFIDAYRRCYRGGGNAASFWESIGAVPPFDALESRLLQQYTLTPGAEAFLAELRTRGIPVFSLSNDVAGWAERRRWVLGIDAYFAGSVISGELGIPKPEPGIYQALARLLPCSPAECLFVDDRAPNLDGAAREGFATVLFGGVAVEGQEAVPGFEALAAYCGL